MLQIGSLLCLATIPFGIINSLHHVVARYPSPERNRAHSVAENSLRSEYALAFASRVSQ